MDTKHCSGCRDDFYNRRGAAAGPCWMAKDAKIVTRYRIYYLTAPTEKGAFTKVRVPNCYHQVNSHVFYEKLPDFVRASDLNRARRSASR